MVRVNCSSLWRYIFVYVLFCFIHVGVSGFVEKESHMSDNCSCFLVKWKRKAVKFLLFMPCQTNL